MSGNADPIATFREIFARAQEEEPWDATAVSLATADASGRPSVRTVLLKRVDEQGFVFFTNYESRKARELDANPRAALCLYWPTQDVQVRVEGPVTRLSDAESDSYFAERPRGSQLGAWASQQSRPLASRFQLLRRYLQTKARYAGRPVPRPPFWGGFRVAAERIEIWYNRTYRLHERFLYQRTADGWSRERLYP